MGICFSGCCFSDVQPAEATAAEVVVMNCRRFMIGLWWVK